MAEKPKADPRAAWRSLVKYAVGGRTPAIGAARAAARALEQALIDGVSLREGARHLRSNEDAFVDCQFVESLLDSEDSAIPWNRAARLLKLHRYIEAGRDYLEAAARFQREADQGNGLTGDESDWVDDALLHACRAFISAGHFLTAAVVAQQLPENLRRSVAEEIQSSIKD